MEPLFAISFFKTFLYMTDILFPSWKQHLWCQAFPKNCKQLKGQELVHLKSVYKILL